MAYYLLLTIFVISFMTQGNAAASIYEGLYDQIMSQAGDPRQVPITDIGHPVEVDVQMDIVDISNVDRDHNQVNVALMVAVSWNSGIQWDPASVNGLDILPVPRGSIWYPKIVITNAASDLYDQAGPEISLMADGHALTFHYYRLDIFCDLSEGDKCKIGAVNDAHGAKLIHLTDPEEQLRDFRPGMNRFRHQTMSYPLKESRNVKSVYSLTGLPGENERIDLEFSFSDPHRHYRHPNVFRWQ